jgi:rubredoxin---NAD+ reductase
MMNSAPLVIIGSGLAGFLTVEAIRAQKSDRSIIMITEDSGDFYRKPMLSFALDQGKMPDDLVLNSRAEMMQRLSIDIIAHQSVRSIDRSKRLLHLSGADPIEYGQLILALGSHVSEPEWFPVNSKRCMQVNHLTDYRAFRSHLDALDVKRIAVVGGGFVGIEFAHDLTSSDRYAVHWIHRGAYPLDRHLPYWIGTPWLASLEHGVNWVSHLNEGINHCVESEKGVSLTLHSGEVIEVDCVLAAFGIAPSIGLAEHASLAVERGIVTDRFGQTSDPMIYALGDCAQMDGHNPFFVPPIRMMAEALAKTLAGEKTETLFNLPLVVRAKTSRCPMVLTWMDETEGQWQVEGVAPNLSASFFNPSGVFSGFALMGDRIKERQQWIDRLGF